MFNKNLELIDNLSLKRRLEKISTIESRVGVSYCITPSNDYVLLKDDLPTDDLQNPRKAIKEQLQNNIKTQMNPNDIIITFGIGLGYLLDEVFNTYPSKIFIYEPDLNLLHFVLSNVDISDHLSSGRIFISNNLEEIISRLSATYLTKDKVEIVYLQNYAITKNKELLLLTQKVFDACKSKMVDINTITKFSKIWLANTIDNITFINSNETFLLSDLKDRFKGQTALIAGAGPSLSDNIDNIKNNRDRFVIFAVNKTVKYLLENNITPDFVICLDAKNMQSTLGGLEDKLIQSNLILDIRTDKTAVKRGFKKIFFNFSETDFFIKKLAKFNPFMEFYESGGSASTLALVSAVKMGFSKIILAGIDLAFKNNQIYSYGENMQRISQDKIIVDKVYKNLVQVKSVTGELVTTREDYEAFIHHFGTLISELNHHAIYNISSFGALINGVKNVKFNDINLPVKANPSIIKDVQPFKFNFKEFIDEEFISINNIIGILSKRMFSPALVSAITKSVMVYQYLQAEVLTVLQKNFDNELAEKFVENTKIAIKTIVEQLQKNKLF